MIAFIVYEYKGIFTERFPIYSFFVAKRDLYYPEIENYKRLIFQLYEMLIIAVMTVKN